MEIKEYTYESNCYEEIYEIDESDFIAWCEENEITEVDEDVWKEFTYEHKPQFIDSNIIDSCVERKEVETLDLYKLQDLLNEFYETRA